MARPRKVSSVLAIAALVASACTVHVGSERVVAEAATGECVRVEILEGRAWLTYDYSTPEEYARDEAANRQCIRLLEHQAALLVQPDGDDVRISVMRQPWGPDGCYLPNCPK